MDVLAIGNSFSQDATRYLHQIAESDDYKMTVVNLNAYRYSLSDHYKNSLTDADAYSLEYNGETTGFRTSLKEALLSRDWDAVVLQQLSSQSVSYETFQPYITNLANYIRKYAPKAKIFLHQTWAYEESSKELMGLGYKEKVHMSLDAKNAYEKAALEIDAYRGIPSGQVFLKLSALGFRMYRNGVNASRGIGRYALGLLWYKSLTGRGIMDNAFSKFDEDITPEEIEKIKYSVKELYY